ncbi:MAG: hypothetical protein ACE5DW_05290 [Thermodesulfobacteriota bacterium]
MGKASRQKKEKFTEKTGEKTSGKKGRTLKCYKCAKEVSEYDEGCPHCGAKPPRVNPAVLARVLLGIVIAIVLYIYLM